MRDSIRLGSVAGVRVGLHWSLLAVAAVLTLALSGNLLPPASPGASDIALLAAGVVGAVAFLASVLAHELGHALMARREGIGVDGITLWLLGGVARLEREADTPGAELRIAAVGPGVSVALAAAFGAVSMPLTGLAGALTAWLALINVVLAVFNLLPAAPLDGGRILKSALWWRSGDRLLATARAGTAGRVLGAVVIAAGLAELVWAEGVGGLWTTMVGWFILGAASAERAWARRRIDERARPAGADAPDPDPAGAAGPSQPA